MTGVEIMNLCMLCAVLAAFQARNVCVFCSQTRRFFRTFLWIHCRSPSHVPYLVRVRPRKCHVHPLCPRLFLSSRPCLLLSVPVIDLDPECRVTSPKFVVLPAIQNPVSVGSGWGSMIIVSLFWERRARATQVPSGGRKNTYGRTQNQYVLRYFACQFRSQHASVCKKHSVVEKICKLLVIVTFMWLSHHCVVCLTTGR